MGMTENFYRNIAKTAAEACYALNKDKYKFAMQVVIEHLVLDEDTNSYTAEEMEQAILKAFKKKGLI